MSDLAERLIVGAVDARFDQLRRREPYTAYGSVASVDLVNRKAGVYVSGEATASAGFVFPPSMDLMIKVGDRVRVVIDPRGDRYVDELYGASGGGSSFPASPSSGQRYFRTDLGLEFYWTGTQWLSTNVYVMPLYPRHTQPMALGTYSYDGTNPYSGVHSIVVQRWTARTFVNTTNNGSNFWYIALYRNGILVGDFSTAGNAPSGWVPNTGPLGVTASTDIWAMTAANSGSPGVLYLNSSLLFRVLG